MLYLADTQHTALFETSAVYSHSGTISGRKQPPRVMLSVDVNLQHVVDLTSLDVQNAPGVSAGELCAPWRLAQEEGRAILTHDVGAGARNAGCEALLFPSAALPGAVNLGIIVDRLRVGSNVTLYTDPASASPQVTVAGTHVP